MKYWSVKILIFGGLFVHLSIGLSGQKVTTAEEVNIRNDYAYDILGLIEDHILLFRDHGKNQTISIYDKNLKFKRDRELSFEKRRVRIMNVTPMDSVFNVIYGYRQKDTTYLRIRAFDKNVILADSVILEKSTHRDQPRFYRFANSEDRSHTVLFGEDKKNLLHIKVINNRNKEMTWFSKLDLGDMDFFDDFRKIVVTNQGLVLILFEMDNIRYNKDKHMLSIIGLMEGSVVLRSAIDVREMLSSDLRLDYNNITGDILISGLMHENKANAATGYFFVNKHIQEFANIENPVVTEFDLKFIAEVYGEKVGKEKELENYIIQDMVLRQDGGFLMVMEMQRDFSRRSAFTPATPNARRIGSYSGIGWTDHYNEDVIVLAVRPDGSEHWKTILYKKQFSQDDGGAFSSFFIFKTPSRLKLIYNDEIKNNNTASEYILDPLGRYERNSLLSTDYQNLRLRFKDALQISNSSLLVPSEKNFNLRLVKIDYSS